MDGKYKRREQDIFTALDKWTGFPGFFYEWQQMAPFSSDFARAELCADLKCIKSGKHKDEYVLRKLDGWIYHSFGKQMPSVSKHPSGRRSTKSRPDLKASERWGSDANPNEQRDGNDPNRDRLKSVATINGGRFKSESSLIDLQPANDKKPRRLRWGKKNKKKYADTVSLYTFDELMEKKKDEADSRSLSDLEKAANKYGTLPRSKIKSFFSKATITRIKLNPSNDSKSNKQGRTEMESDSPPATSKGKASRVRVNATYATPVNQMKKRGDLFEVERAFQHMSADTSRSNGINSSYDRNSEGRIAPQSYGERNNFVIMRETSLHNGASSGVPNNSSPRDSLRGRNEKKFVVSQPHPLFYMPAKKTDLGEI